MLGQPSISPFADQTAVLPVRPAGPGEVVGLTPTAESPARIGPNAVTRVAEALRAAGGDPLATQVFCAAGCSDWLTEPPETMVEEARVIRLHRIVAACLPEEQAVSVLSDAGHRTGAYILANRIPRLARMTLRASPARLAGPLLLTAIRRNAWTFAGSGKVAVGRSHPWRIRIAENPLAVPGCPWHRAVFETLFRALVHAEAVVAHLRCKACNGEDCLFEISVPAPG